VNGTIIVEWYSSVGSVGEIEKVEETTPAYLRTQTRNLLSRRASQRSRASPPQQIFLRAVMPCSQQSGATPTISPWVLRLSWAARRHGRQTECLAHQNSGEGSRQ